jgi:hypothetical protein
VVSLSEQVLPGETMPAAEQVPPSTNSAAAVTSAAESELPTPSEAATAPLSEADLMAVLPEEETRAAAAVAEWFVIDFFTVDGGAGSRERVAAVVPDLAADVLPHERTDDLSYVEWARSLRVEPSGLRSYDVTVGYGSVASRDGGAITRRPVKAVAVTVRFTDRGASEIVGLPRPQATELPATADIPVEPAPDSVVAAAVAEAAAFGDEPEAIGAYRIAGRWQVVVLLQDPASGVSWPLAFEVDG